MIATAAAAASVHEARSRRRGTLTITLGTGCCESTAPFLYEDFLPGPDQQAVGEVDGVVVYAPEYLRDLYPDDESVTLDVVDGLAESLSIETEWGQRLFLRGHAVDLGAEAACEVPTAGGGHTGRRAAELDVGQRVKGELPEALKRLRLR